MDMEQPKKKGLALLVLEHAKAKKGETEKESVTDSDEEDDSDAGLESAMDDFIAAVSAKDSKAAVEAFKSLYEMC